MNSEMVIRADNLSRRFGETIAVNQMKLEIYRGEVFGLLGHNGAGKTTTVRLMNGVLAPSAGTLRVLGLSPVDDGPELRRKTGVLTETPSLDERLTAIDNLTIYADLYGVPVSEVSSRVNEYLDFFGLLDRAEERVAGYSKGMKQKLALARSMLHSPEILFLDEPTSGLDPVTSRSVHNLILDLSERQGHSVILCTHNLEEAQRLCDRVAVLEHGRLIAVGAPRELAQKFVRNVKILFEVEEEDVPTALKLLNINPAVKSPQQENGHLEAIINQRAGLPELIASLVEAKVRLYQVTPQEPSLEDVYFALHREAEV
jgi:ABC-2 type transport system ATP-binding protein